jgi:hypothetical protein
MIKNVGSHGLFPSAFTVERLLSSPADARKKIANTKINNRKYVFMFFSPKDNYGSWVVIEARLPIELSAPKKRKL